MSQACNKTRRRVSHTRTYFQFADASEDRALIAPDLPAPLPIEDDRIGVDPAMRVILRWRPQPKLSQALS